VPKGAVHLLHGLWIGWLFGPYLGIDGLDETLEQGAHVEVKPQGHPDLRNTRPSCQYPAHRWSPGCGSHAGRGDDPGAGASGNGIRAQRHPEVPTAAEAGGGLGGDDRVDQWILGLVLARKLGGMQNILLMTL